VLTHQRQEQWPFLLGGLVRQKKMLRQASREELVMDVLGKRGANVC